jgi:hypothetical protein
MYTSRNVLSPRGVCNEFTFIELSLVPVPKFISVEREGDFSEVAA